MALTRRGWKRIGAGVLLVALLAPGWSGRLEPVSHDDVLAAASLHPGTFGVTAGADATGAEWHVEYLDSGMARALTAFGLRRTAPSLVAPDFAAHVPAPVGGVQRADAYYRVVWSLRWPWWIPGGGMDWTRP